MIYRRLSFLAVSDLATRPPPSPSPKQVVSLSPVFLCVAGRAYWREGEGGGGGLGAKSLLLLLKSDVGGKGLSSINHPILSDSKDPSSADTTYMLHHPPKQIFLDLVMSFLSLVQNFRPVARTTLNANWTKKSVAAKFKLSGNTFVFVHSFLRLKLCVYTFLSVGIEHCQTQPAGSWFL